MDKESRKRSLKVVRVLCDGCERASANVYCPDCAECACSTCAEQLHVRGRSSKSRPARTCRGRRLNDLHRSVGVLALCVSCRARPAVRYGNGEVYALCSECRIAFASSDAKAKAPGDIVKRAIVEEMGRKKKGRKRNGEPSKYRSSEKRSDGDSTGGDDGTDAGFSASSSAE